MKNNKSLLIKSYLSNLQVDVEMAEYTKCPANWHDIDYVPEYNKLYLIYSGEGMLKVGENIYYPQPRQIYLMPAGTIQSYSAINENTFEKHWCHFTAKVGEINLFDLIDIPLYADFSKDKRIVELFEKLIINYESNIATSSLTLKATMMEIIAWYIDCVNIADIHLSKSTPTLELTKVLTYIENNINDDLSIERLANLVHFHPNYFIRLFKEHIGCSPLQYINRIRLNKAKCLLVSTDISIKRITDITGFNDPSYFSKTFKRHTGLSPIQYRNKT